MPRSEQIRGGFEERLWSRVHKTETCWLWTGARSHKGHTTYGNIGFMNKTYSVHRIVYELYVGDIPPGMVVMHACDVGLCVNPAHLRVGSYRDNTQDAIRKHRLGKDERGIFTRGGDAL